MRHAATSYMGHLKSRKQRLRNWVKNSAKQPSWQDRTREGYGRYDFSLFSRIWLSAVDLVTQSLILLSGGGGRVVDSFAFPVKKGF